MPHIAITTALHNLVDTACEVIEIGGGFQFTEGPIWHPVHDYLLFSDMPGDVRRRWDRVNGVVEVKRPASKCNGMTYDADLNLIVCEHATSSIVRERTDGRRETLASHFEGKELNSPNDVCVHSSGAIYFSAPWYGRMPVYGVERPRQLGFQGVYRSDPDSGAVDLVVDRDMFGQPNGLCFSPDERLLYINDTEKALIRVFEVSADGTLANGRIFAENIRSDSDPSAPDGMKCDALGNIWVTAPGGLWVYAPDGSLIGKISVPQMVGNIAWGGPGFDQLYICASSSTYVLPTKVRGRAEPFCKATRVKLPVAMLPEGLQIDTSRCAMLIQDLQNDVITECGAFGDGGAPEHAKAQNVVANVARLATAARAKGIPVIHAWFITEPDAVGLTSNAPIFQGIAATRAVVRGTWGAQPASGLEPHSGDYVIEKMRMSPWEGSKLETILRATGRDVIINTGAWTNMSVEHTARTGADKGYHIVVPQDCCSSLNDEWHRASISIALPNVATVTDTDAVIAAIG